MLGAILGDMAGSVYEFDNTDDYYFPLIQQYSRPTDAVAKALMETYKKSDEEIKAAVVKEMREFGRRYPHAGYGRNFRIWLMGDDAAPYNSFGNGSAMRVSPCGWLYRTLDDTLHAAQLTAEVTHDHPEGIRGAQAEAAAVFLARAGARISTIRTFTADEFGYDMTRSLEQIGTGNKFDATCQGTVPEAITAFCESENYEDAVRKAVVMGGDSDTIACMAGAIAEAHYGMPEELKDEALRRLDRPVREIVKDFYAFSKKHAPRAKMPAGLD
jgi:ADP-ribosylglycohydrolase